MAAGMEMGRDRLAGKLLWIIIDQMMGEIKDDTPVASIGNGAAG